MEVARKIKKDERGKKREGMMRTRDRWKGSEETEETNNYKIKGKEINNKNIRERRDLKRKKEYINKVKKEKERVHLHRF